MILADLWENSSSNHDSSSNFPETTISARKLCANLWELEPFYPLGDMHKGAGNPPPRHHQRRRHKGFDVGDDSRPHPPGSPTSLRRHITESLTQHHRSLARNSHALPPLSSGSCGSSSMEV